MYKFINQSATGLCSELKIKKSLIGNFILSVRLFSTLTAVTGYNYKEESSELWFNSNLIELVINDDSFDRLQSVLASTS